MVVFEPRSITRGYLSFFVDVVWILNFVGLNLHFFLVKSLDLLMKTIQSSVNRQSFKVAGYRATQVVPALLRRS